MRFFAAALGFALLVGGVSAPAAFADAPARSAVTPTDAPTDTVTFAYAEVPLRRVLADVEARTGVRFLYRDALIAGVTVTLRTERADVLGALTDALRAHDLRVQVDARRQQALITQASRPARPSQTLTGQVLDGATGARLPLATITWRESGRLRGTATGDDGTFRIRVDDALAQRDTLVLTASYVGYASQTIHVDLRDAPGELSVRLDRTETEAPEVVVHSSALQSDLDTTWHTLIRPDRAASLGESSVLRALEPLPAVGLTPTLGEGLNVRGSQSDAFQVLLDGMPIYNQNHLFGLFDAFNADALQTVGFYYGVAPAEYAAPPGGTLAFRTRTGAQTTMRGTGGASNVAVHATLEGPLGDGRGSWLLSGRHSYLNTAGWLGNDALVAQGLGVDPNVETLSVDRQFDDVASVRPDDPSARFYDVHGKLYWETSDGARVAVSAYAGGDDTDQGAQRVFLVNAGRRDTQVELEPISASNDWGNEAVGVQFDRPVGETVFTHTRFSLSRYHARFDRAGFRTSGLRVRTDPDDFAFDFRLDNELRTTELEQRVTWTPRGGTAGTWTAGVDVAAHDLTYTDAYTTSENQVAPRFEQERATSQFDVFVQTEWSDVSWVDVDAGVRLHYFDAGSYLRGSPRLQVRLFPDAALSVGAGYSRNHQFLHRISFATDNVDVWVTSTERQPPHVSDHVTAGLYWTPVHTSSRTTSIQVEAYLKDQRNVRLYEPLPQAQFGIDGLSVRPFTATNTTHARGLEALARQRVGPATATVGYTLARVDLDAPRAARDRPAPWDRRHQVTARLDATLGGGVSAFASGYVASGVPNTFARLPDEPDRLDAYRRLDVGVEASWPVGTAHLDVRGAVYNVLDRANPWYRTPVFTLTTVDGPFGRRVVDQGWDGATVYDLGVQPSFAVAVRW